MSNVEAKLPFLLLLITATQDPNAYSKIGLLQICPYQLVQQQSVSCCVVGECKEAGTAQCCPGLGRGQVAHKWNGTKAARGAFQEQQKCRIYPPAFGLFLWASRALPSARRGASGPEAFPPGQGTSAHAGTADFKVRVGLARRGSRRKRE